MGTGNSLALAPVMAPRSAEGLMFLQQLDRSGEHWYGPPHVKIGKTKVQTSRAVYAVYNGRTYAGMPVVSTCGDEDCLRPDHLIQSPAEKQPVKQPPKESVKAIGPRGKNKVLTDEIVNAMRDIYESEGASHTELGRRFGFSQVAVSRAFRARGFPQRSRSERIKMWHVWRNREVDS